MNVFLKEYFTYLKLEKNLSENTVSSYRNDLSSFIRFIEEREINDPSQIDSRLLISFFTNLEKVGLTSSSAARYYSSLKGFLNYLFVNNYIKSNPIEKVSPPKLAKNLPGVLSFAEIEKILSLPNTAEILGMRDKTILEVFYACGLRISELISLKLSDLFLNEEMIRVFGKGSKERVVPIGSSAINWINVYLTKSRPLLQKRMKSENYLFLNSRGSKLSRMGVWKIVSRYIKESPVSKKLLIRILLDIRLQHILLKVALIFVRFRKCLGMQIFLQLKSILTSIENSLSKFTNNFILAANMK